MCESGPLPADNVGAAGGTGPTIRIAEGEVLHLHPHPLQKVDIRKRLDVKKYGFGASFVCSECKQLSYDCAYVCKLCEQLHICLSCFSHFKKEQDDAIRDVMQEEMSDLHHHDRSRTFRSMSVVPKDRIDEFLGACAEGDCDHVKEIVDKNEFTKELDLECISDHGEYRGQTGLVLAAKRGHRNIVVLLLERGCNAEAVDNDGLTPLMHAALGGHVEVLDELIFAGVSVDRIAFCGYTALLLAASKGHALCLKRLLAAGANGNARTPSGRSALVVAAFNGHAEVIQLLLEQSIIDIHAKDNEGYSALDAAIACKRYGVERILKRALQSDIVK